MFNYLGKILLGLFTFSLSSILSAQCTLNMVYKEGAKLPLIEEKPSHAGAYHELFQMAAERIQCSLVVSRYPKKRLHKLLEAGELDFYPGASFSKKRAKYLYYVANGFETGEFGITGINIPALKSYEDLKNYEDITWLMEFGSSKTERAKKLGVKTQTRRHMDLEYVSKYISRSPDKSYFYVADKELVDYFPKKTGLKSLEAEGLKIHKKCCGGNAPMYMGFSRFSPHFKEKPNPNYDKSKNISPDNFPTLLDESSVAYRLGQALLELKQSGETEKIYHKWFTH